MDNDLPLSWLPFEGEPNAVDETKSVSSDSSDEGIEIDNSEELKRQARAPRLNLQKKKITPSKPDLKVSRRSERGKRLGDITGKYDVICPEELGPHLIIFEDRTGSYAGGMGQLLEIKVNPNGKKLTARYIRRDLAKNNQDREGKFEFNKDYTPKWRGKWRSDAGTTGEIIIEPHIPTKKRMNPNPPSDSLQRAPPNPKKKRANSTPPPKPKKRIFVPQLNPGQRVECSYKLKDPELAPQYYPATINRVNSDGTYDIKWDDKDSKQRTHRKRGDIRLLVANDSTAHTADKKHTEAKVDSRSGMRNPAPNKRSTSVDQKKEVKKYIGVAYSKQRKKWYAKRRFTFTNPTGDRHYKTVRSDGFYKTAKEAARQSDRLVFLYHRKTCRLNFRRESTVAYKHLFQQPPLNLYKDKKKQREGRFKNVYKRKHPDTGWYGRVRNKFGVQAQSNHTDELTCAQLLNADCRKNGMTPPNPELDDIINPNAQFVGSQSVSMNRNGALGFNQTKELITSVSNGIQTAIKTAMETSMVKMMAEFQNTIGMHLAQAKLDREDGFKEAKNEREELREKVEKHEKVIIALQKKLHMD